jgi:integrase
MQRAKLTNSAIEKFQCREGREQDSIYCGETRGFGVRLSRKSGAKTFFLLFRVKDSKRERYISIGRFNDPWRVDQARVRALELKAQMLYGIDPVEEAERKEAERQEREKLDAAHTATLRQVMEHYLEYKRTKHGPLRPKTKESIRDMIERHLSEWLDKPMAATVTKDACFVRFTEISKTAKASANLTMVYLRALCHYARGLYERKEDGAPTIFAVNPVTRMIQGGHKLNKEKPRTGRVPLDRVGRVWLTLERRRADARDVDDRTAADWVSTMYLTGMRLTESGSLRWSQIDWTAKTIRLFGDVEDVGDGFAGVKNHNDIVIPMSTVLYDLLLARKREPAADPKVARRRRNQRSREYVFASCGKTPYMRDPRATMEAVSNAAGRHITPHDFRRTMEDLAKAVKVDPDERRQLLNHLAEDVHGESYSNNPDPEVLRPAVEAVAKYIVDAAALAEAQESGTNVVPFAARA